MEKNLVATLQKSYYGKAKVRIENGVEILRSYDTDVFAYDTINGNIMKLWNGYSKTTMNHINDFLLQHGFPTIGKKEWLSLPCENDEPVYNVYMSNGFYTHKGTYLLTEKEAEKEVERLTANNQYRMAWYD